MTKDEAIRRVCLALKETGVGVQDAANILTSLGVRSSEIKAAAAPLLAERN